MVGRQLGEGGGVSLHICSVLIGVFFFKNWKVRLWFLLISLLLFPCLSFFSFSLFCDFRRIFKPSPFFFLVLLLCCVVVLLCAGGVAGGVSIFITYFEKLRWLVFSLLLLLYLSSPASVSSTSPSPSYRLHSTVPDGGRESYGITRVWLWLWWLAPLFLFVWRGIYWKVLAWVCL